jgi:glucose/arabinose dehydrogenase
MKTRVAFLVSLCTVAGTLLVAQQKQYPYPPVRDQRGAVPAGPRVAPWNSPPLGDGPFPFDSYEQRGLRAVVVTKGLSHPWSIAFLPDGVILITERQGRLRVVRLGTLEPQPVAGIPAVTSLGTMAGLMDIALHPNFAQNKWIYISYHKPMGTAKTVDGSRDAPIASNSILRGTWDGKGLSDIRDIFVADDIDMEASRIAFGPDGMLYMGIGGPGTGSKISMDRAQGTNDLAGKILRMKDDGTVPPDNPFVGQAGKRPEIYTLGHRGTLGLAMHPGTGDMWQNENGPNGGDEINILKPGRNYGWPIVSYGRDYPGPWHNEVPGHVGFEAPVVLWIPAIAVSGMAFYTGDKLPKWKGDVFVGSLRTGEIPGTGHLERILFNEKMQELRRESLLTELRQRIRDVRQGPDGLLYVLTDEKDGAVLRIEPAQ